MKKNLLKDIDLSKNEIKAYEVLLELGEVKPNELAVETGLSRENSYTILKNLMKKGLVEEFDKKKKLTYRLHPPKNLLKYIEEKRKKAEELEKSIESTLPKLISDFNLTYNEPGETYYEGADSVAKIYEHILKERPKEVLVFRSVLDKNKTEKYLTGYKKRRALLGIKTRILSSTIPTEEKLKKDKESLRERRYIPEDIFQLNAQINIYNNTVSFIGFKKKIMGFVLENADIAQSLKTTFELLWNVDFNYKEEQK